MITRICMEISTILKVIMLVILGGAGLYLLELNYNLVEQIEEEDRVEIETYTNNDNKEPKSTKLTQDEFMAMLPADIPKEYHDLLWETAVMESNATTGAKQVRGFALGIMQVEPTTEQDIWDNFLQYRPALREKVEGFSRDLQHNTQYNMYIAYLCYYRNLYNKNIDLSDKWTRAWVYKKFYNTNKGKGTTSAYYYGRN